MAKAILIAVPEYDTHEPLPLTLTTVSAVAESLEVGDYIIMDPELMRGGSSTSIGSKINSVLERIDRDDTLLLLWTGHGCKQGEGFYLVCSNTPPNGVSSINAIDAKTIGTLVANAKPEKTLIVLDTCYAGQAATEIIGTIMSILATHVRVVGRERALAVIASTHALEEAEQAVFCGALHHVLSEFDAFTPWSNNDRFITPDQLAVAIKKHLTAKGYQPTVEQLAIGLGLDFIPNPQYRAGLGAEDVETRRAHLALFDGVAHFAHNSRGIEVGETGWYFTGRVNLLRELVAWLQRGKDGLRVVTGPPGSGKSALLGRLASLSDERLRAAAERASVLEFAAEGTVPTLGIVDVCIHVKGKSLSDCLRVLCDGLDIERQDPIHIESIDVLSAVSKINRRIVVLIDALDEAATGHATLIVSNLIRPLSQIPGLLVLIGSRHSIDGRLILEGEKRHGRLHAAFGSGIIIHDLVDEVSTDADIANYVRHRLKASGKAFAPASIDAVALKIADRAEGSFLYARVVSRTLQEQERLDGELPTDALHAFVTDLQKRFSGNERRVDDLLNALAWGLGKGLTRRVWGPIASALSSSEQHYTDEDVSWVLAHAGWHIIETGEEGQAVYRLAHQAIADHYNGLLERSNAHHWIFNALTEGVEGAAWLDTDRYLWRYLAFHGLIADSDKFVDHQETSSSYTYEAGTLPSLCRLIQEPGFLAVAEPMHLLRALKALLWAERINDQAIEIANIYLRIIDTLHDKSPIGRMPLFHLKALVEAPEASSNLEPPVPTDWRCGWARMKPSTPNITIGRHDMLVSSVVLGQVAGRNVIASGSYDQTVRLWDAASGEALGAPLQGHESWVTSVALGEIAERAVIASGSYDCTIRLWDAASGKALGPPLQGHESWVTSVALGEVIGGVVIVSGSNDGTIRLWDANNGEAIGLPLHGHESKVTSVALGWVAGRATIVSGGGDHSIRLWDAASGKALGPPLQGHEDMVTSVALGKVADRATIVSGGRDCTIRLWDANSGDALRPPLQGHQGWVTSVAIRDVAGRAAIVSAGHDSTIRLWDASSGETLGVPLQGHQGWVTSVALGEVAGGSVIVSGGEDRTVRSWDAASWVVRKEPPSGHRGRVNCVSSGVIADREVVVSGGDDGTVRLWVANSGEVLGDSMQSNCEVVRVVVLGMIAGRSVIASGSYDGTIQLWDVTNGDALGAPLQGHEGPIYSIALGEITGRAVIVSGGEDDTIRLWDATKGDALRAPLQGHNGGIASIALGEISGHTVIVSGSHDRTLRLWDFASGEARGAPLSGHEGPIQSVAFGELSGHPAIVSGSDDHGIRLWDLTSGEALGAPLQGHEGSVRSVAFGKHSGREVVVSGGADHTVRLWDAIDQTLQLTIELPSAVLSVAFCSSKWVVAGTTSGLLGIRLS